MSLLATGSRRGALLLVGLVIGSLFVGCDSNSKGGKELVFEPTQAVPSPYGPVIGPRNGSVEEIGGTVSNVELVIGVEVNGEVRAYPLNMLSSPAKQVINDELGGEQILIAWCPICFNAQVYKRKVGEKELTFFVSGYLWEGNLIFRDQETQTMWSMIRSEAMEGELAGTKLESIPAVITSWGTWTEIHPETTAVIAERTEDKFTTRIYRDKAPYVTALETADGSTFFTYQELAKRRVLNTEVDGKPIVFFFDFRFGTPYCYSRVVGDKQFEFRFADEKVLDQDGNEWDLRKGKPLAEDVGKLKLERVGTIYSYRKPWEIFCPESKLWKEGETKPAEVPN